MDDPPRPGDEIFKQIYEKHFTRRQSRYLEKHLSWG